MRSVCVAVVVALFACGCVAQGLVTIDGTVLTDCGSGNEDVPAIRLMLTNGSPYFYSQLTDSEGYFAFEGIEAGVEVQLSVVDSAEFLPASIIPLTASNITVSIELIPVLDMTAPPDEQVECGTSTDPLTTGFPEVACFCPTEVWFVDTITSESPCLEYVTRTWTAIASFGATAERVQEITVVDTTNPIVTAPPSVTIECGSDTSPATTGEATAVDSCSNFTISFHDFTQSGCPAVDDRTWVATDACGNSASADQVITMVDRTNPDFVVSPSAFNGTCGDASHEWYESFAYSVVEDCLPVSVEMALDGSCSGTATVTASDECGNVSSQSTTFTTQSPNPNDPNDCSTCWTG